MEKLRSFAKSQHVEKAELVFKLCYLCLAFISFNTFCARQWYLSYLSYGIVIFGLFIGLLRLTHIKDFITPSIFILVSFCFSYVLSSINTMQYGVIENVQALVWMAVQYFLVFAYDKTRDERGLKKERSIILSVVLIYTFIAAIIGIVMMLTEYSYYEYVEGYNIYGGFIFNRLFGIYMDCNYGAVLSIISIVISVYIYKSVNKYIKALLVVNIVAEYLFICFSDSRTGMMAAFATILVYIICKDYKGELKDFYKSKEFWKSLALSIVLVLLFVGSLLIVKNISSEARSAIARISARNAGASVEEQNVAAIEAEIGRYENGVADSNVSNGRFDIWGSAIDLFKAHPIIGVSFRNNIETARAEIPSTYIAIAGYDSMHNFFFDILSSQGIVGTIIAVFLIAAALITVAKTYNQYEEYGLLLSIIAAIFASMLFYSETFYMNTPGAFIFWYILGYMVNYKGQKRNLVNG